MKRTLLAGLLGGLALNAAMLLTFRLIGFEWNGGGILLDPAVQSPKLIALELVFWAAIALSEAFAIAFAFETRRS